jgi:putative ABC transport system permease protein
MQRSRVMLKNGKYPNAAAYSRFHETFAARLAAASGSPVVFSSWPPFVEAPEGRVETETTAASAGTIAVSPGYFSLFRIAIRAGREFADADSAGSNPAAIISDTLARQLFQNGAALGRRVRVIQQTPDGLAAGPWRTVIGVAADVRQAYDDPNRADFYTPKIPDGRYGTFYLRSRRPEALLLADLRSAAAEVDLDAVISQPRSVADDDQRLAGTKFITGLLGGFAVTAAFLSMLGIYGITAYTVQQRRLEVAIRIALGAAEQTIVRMFLRHGGVLLGIGTVTGLAGSVVLSGALRHQVFGVQRFDVLIFLSASVLLVAAGLTAVWWPARRIAGVHPASVLNSQ